MNDAAALDDRTALRARLRAQRASLSAAERVAAASGVLASLEQLPEFQVDQRIAGYWAVGGELPLHAAVARLRARGQQYFLPVIEAERNLRFAALLPNAELRPNRYGIPEPVHAPGTSYAPEQVELVLLPLVAFDRRGQRLGMGAGYYDRSFAFLRARARPTPPLLVGIGYSFQEVPSLTVQAHDVALDYVVTEKELISCAPAPLS
jgi:5-formyltetrahydrofolate cyclo-ligase